MLSMSLFVNLSGSWLPKCKNAIFSKTEQHRATVSIDDLQEVVHGLLQPPITSMLKLQMAEIRHLEIRHDANVFLLRVVLSMRTTLRLFCLKILYIARGRN